MKEALGDGINILFSKSESRTPESEVKLSEVNTLDTAILAKAIEEAQAYPKLSIWSPKTVAVFRYLQLTIPRYRMSHEAAELLEAAIAAKYPTIYNAVLTHKSK